MIPAAQGPTSQRVDRVVSVLAPLLGVNRATSGELRRVMLTHQFTTFLPTCRRIWADRAMACRVSPHSHDGLQPWRSWVTRTS